MNKLVIGKDVFEVLLSEAEIQERTEKLSLEIASDYRDKTPVFIGILNGAVLFMSDLVKRYPGECEIDFLKLSSYGDEKISSGRVRMLKDLNCDITGRDVIVVEDIVDSGLSIKFVEDLIGGHHPASMKVASLLVKPNSIKYDVKIDYIGFNIPDKFVIGYGLDYAQKYRNLRDIYALCSDGEKT